MGHDGRQAMSPAPLRGQEATRAERSAAGLRRVPFGSDASAVRAILDEDGGLILTGVLTAEEVAAVNRELEPDLAGRPAGAFGAEVSSVTRRTEADDKAYNGSRTRHLPHCYRRSRTYREKVLGSPVLAGYVAALVPGPVGAHALYASIVIEIGPGETAQGLHRDGESYFAPLGLNHADAVCYLANGILALGEVTEEIGATRVIPGSHRWSDFSDFASQDQTIPATMAPGDMLFYNGKMLHGGGANTTADRTRRVLATAFSFPFVMGEEAWPFTVSAEEVRTYPRQVQSMLGFRSKAPNGQEPGFFWRAETQPLERYLGLQTDKN